MSELPATISELPATISVLPFRVCSDIGAHWAGSSVRRRPEGEHYNCAVDVALRATLDARCRILDSVLRPAQVSWSHAVQKLPWDVHVIFRCQCGKPGRLCSKLVRWVNSVTVRFQHRGVLQVRKRAGHAPGPNALSRVELPVQMTNLVAHYRLLDILPRPCCG